MWNGGVQLYTLPVAPPYACAPPAPVPLTSARLSRPGAAAPSMAPCGHMPLTGRAEPVDPSCLIHQDGVDKPERC